MEYPFNAEVSDWRKPQTQEKNMTKIVWNGCDNYVEADQAAQRGYDFDGEKLYTQREAFTAFDATEINPEDLPKDEDGEPDFNGVFGTETGKFYYWASRDVVTVGETA